MAARIRRDDEVIVLTGRDKDKRDKAKNVLSSGRVIVEGINLVRKHQKPVSALNRLDSIAGKKVAIQISNIVIPNTATGKANRVGFRLKDNKRVHFFKSNSEATEQFGVVRRRDCMITTKTK